MRGRNEGRSPDMRRCGVHSSTHEPDGYACPFCLIQQGAFDERNQPSDIVAVTERAYARIAPKWWPANPGAVLVIPRVHVENIYDLPVEDGEAVWDLTRQVAIAIRSTYRCTGTSLRQHNEPDGDQDVWHLHMHIFPRYADDRLYQRHKDAAWVPPSAREPYAVQLRQALGLGSSFR